MRMMTKLSRPLTRPATCTATCTDGRVAPPERETAERANPWIALTLVTPDSDSPEAPDRMPRPSRRALVLGAVGVLLAGAVVAAAGFLAGGANVARIAPEGAGVNTQHGQLDTFSLHDEKPMKAIGKGVRETTSPTSSPTSTPPLTPPLTP